MVNQDRRHLLTTRTLDRGRIESLLVRAESFARSESSCDGLRGKTVALLFTQSSTRTRVGFAVATARLGGTPIDAFGVKAQEGMAAPESLADTVRVLGDYCDALVIRHHDSAELLSIAAGISTPIINGGSGMDDHPTQALIDLYAIRHHHGGIDDLRIGILGDFKTSRTARALVTTLAAYAPREVRVIAPPQRGLQSCDQLLSPAVIETDELTLDDLDVLYVAGAPPGTGTDQLGKGWSRRLRVTSELMRRLPSSAIVLCALPRTGDIDEDVDADPRARYFEQSAAGLWTRMAVLDGLDARDT